MKDKHHRKPRSRGGQNTPENVVLVPIKHHRAYHTLFGNMLPDEMAKFLSDTWIDKDYYLVAIPRKKRRKKKHNRRKVVIITPVGQWEGVAKIEEV